MWIRRKAYSGVREVVNPQLRHGRPVKEGIEARSAAANWRSGCQWSREASPPVGETAPLSVCGLFSRSAFDPLRQFGPGSGDKRDRVEH
jgi:hypothetical protein